MSPRRVLVVDDDDTIREVAQLSLAAVGGYDVIAASSGTEGLTTAAAEQPDAILLDVMMPGLDGPGTVERLQADPATKDIDVILLTAKVQPADQSRFADLPGVRGVISKPFNAMTLAADVADLLGWQS